MPCLQTATGKISGSGNRKKTDIPSEAEKKPASINAEGLDLSYPAQTRKTDSNYRYMKEIHEMAVTGKSSIEAMGTQMKMPNWDDVLVLGAQLNPMPLDEHDDVSLRTVIGKHAKKPMVLDMPVYISHMSLVLFQRNQNCNGKRQCGSGNCNVQRRRRYPSRRERSSL